MKTLKLLQPRKRRKKRATMAVAASFLSTANLSSSKSLSSSSSSLSLTIFLQKSNVIRQQLLVPFCKTKDTESSSSSVSLCLSKRSFALSLSSSFLLSLAGKGGRLAEAVPLEDEDDLELLEKVKKDRKKRIERQGIINSSSKEKGIVY